MPYRDDPHDDRLRPIEQELDRVRRTLVATRVALTFFVCLAIIQIVSDCWLAKLITSPPAEKGP